MDYKILDTHSHIVPNRKMETDFLYKAKSVVIGHAVGDALGVPVEFKSRQELKVKPVTDMIGYGTYSMPKGTWSDDTSMSLCALDTFCEGKLNFDKVMMNFSRWYYQDVFTATGETFDVGGTCAYAIARYTGEKKSWRECGMTTENSNGNGSLMRIHPFVLYTYKLDTNTKTKIEIVELASALTHAHPRSKMACGIYAFVLWELLNATSNLDLKESIRTGLLKARRYYFDNPEFDHFSKLYHQIVDVDNLEETNPELAKMVAKATEDDIISDGYVVSTLEAAIWCLLTTNSYKDCVLKAVNLGSDTDTVAAVAGGLAGAFYGYDDIPQEWKDALKKQDFIEEMCNRAFSKKL